jgi:hypothetical protein
MGGYVSDARSNDDFQLVSEFRQDYLGNYTIPSHPLATYVLTRQTQQFSVKEMEIRL